MEKQFKERRDGRPTPRPVATVAANPVRSIPYHTLPYPTIPSHTGARGKRNITIWPAAYNKKKGMNTERKGNLPETDPFQTPALASQSQIVARRIFEENCVNVKARRRVDHDHTRARSAVLRCGRSPRP